MKLVHLYPREMNIYGDTGNVLVLRRRLQWRGIPVEVVPVSVGDPLPNDADIVLGGGGQDAAQGEIGADFASRGAQLRAMADDGVVMLAICGTYQMLGHEFVTVEGRRIEGVGVLDVVTRGQAERLIGNNYVDTRDAGRLVGYENHSGLTELGHRRALAGYDGTWTREQRQRWHRGRGPRQRHRHVPARPGAREEPGVRRRSHSSGSGASGREHRTGRHRRLARRPRGPRRRRAPAVTSPRLPHVERAIRPFTALVAVVLAIVLVGATLTACTSNKPAVVDVTNTTTVTGTRTPTAPAYKPPPAQTVAPLPPNATPLAGEVDKTCPYLPSSQDQGAGSMADLEGDRIYRTTVLTKLKPVGCRFYFWRRQYQAISEIAPTTFASPDAARRQ